MEEAEFLADRIGLIDNGQLRAIGTSAYLRSQFSNWMMVEFVVNHSMEELILQFQREVGGRVIYSINDFVRIKLTNTEGVYHKVLSFIEKTRKGQLKTWSVKKGTLEEVCTNFQEN